MFQHVYTLAPFPFPQLSELREKYTYNIRPFTPNGSSKKASWIDGTVLPSDEDDLDDDDIEAITCFTGFIPTATSGMRSKGNPRPLYFKTLIFGGKFNLALIVM